MTYSILSLASGNILESYDSEFRALEAAGVFATQSPWLASQLRWSRSMMRGCP